MKITSALLALAMATPMTFSLTSCETATGTGALAGAGGGAALGSLLGGGRGNNIAAGAILGAGVGALVGHAVDESHREQGDDTYVYERHHLPFGRRLGHGLVESPDDPHNAIDCRGIPPGAVVIDPSTDGRFIRP